MVAELLTLVNCVGSSCDCINVGELTDFLLFNELLDDDEKKASGEGCIGCFLLMVMLPIGLLISVNTFFL